MKSSHRSGHQQGSGSRSSESGSAVLDAVAKQRSARPVTPLHDGVDQEVLALGRAAIHDPTAVNATAPEPLAHGAATSKVPTSSNAQKAPKTSCGCASSGM